MADRMAMGRHRSQADRRRPHRQALHVMPDLGRRNEQHLHARISRTGQPMHSRLEFQEVRQTTLQTTLSIWRQGCNILRILQEVFY